MLKSSCLHIDPSSIQHNLELLGKNQAVMVMVKGNGYGVGSIQFAQFIQNLNNPSIPFLGVSHVSEAVELRESGITLPIFVISAPPYEADLVVNYQLTPAISSFEEAKALEKAAQKKQLSLPVHLFLETGMNRFGLKSDQALNLYTYCMNSPSLTLEGLLSHFSSAEETRLDSDTHEQTRCFHEFLSILPSPPRWVHLANSAGDARFSFPSCNLKRIGLAALGYSLFEQNLRPALTLESPLTFISDCKRGEKVGYSDCYTFQKERGRIGIIPFGYYDGFSGSLARSGGYVLHGGQKAAIIGKICMDFTLIDLSDCPLAKVGDTLTLFGPSLPPEQLAEWQGIDIREVLVRISPRVSRHWHIDSP